MNKRTFLKTGLIFGAGTAFSGKLLAGGSILPDTPSSLVKEFEQYPLPYDYDALEPYIDARTMELHYSKHHAGYTRKFNDAIKDEGIDGKNLEEIFSNVSRYNDAVRNNGGGYYNHNLYWKEMSPDPGKPSAEFKKAIEKEFGSMDSFREEFSKAAGSVFGSGWAWLIMSDNGKLMITTTPNQDNPLMDVAKQKGKPLMNIDVWEHAYYLKYQNRRTEYIDAFWNVLDWEVVSEAYGGRGQ